MLQQNDELCVLVMARGVCVVFVCGDLGGEYLLWKKEERQKIRMTHVKS